MTAGRRPLVIALAAALLVIVGLLIALIAAGGNSDGSDNATPTPTKPADPRAAARAAIEKTAVAYQRALDPNSPADPCRYMTPEAADDVMVFADPRVGARGCKAAARESERRQSQPLYTGPAGVTNIRFLPRVPVAGIQGTAAGAQATWRADPTRSATFVERRGQWLIAK
jgi:hypothetical protein